MTPTPEAPRTIVLSVPLPLKALGGNSRVHFAVRAKAVAAYKCDVSPAILAARPQVPLRTPVVVSYEYFTHQLRTGQGRRIPDGHYRPRDYDNAIRAMKPFQDALVDHGVIPSDSRKFVKLGTVEILSHAESKGQMGVRVTISEAHHA